jgi:hypothetical protein
VAALRRKRITISLRGLDVAFRSRAQASGSTLAALGRRAVVEMLARTGGVATAACEQPVDAHDKQSVKMTIRLPRRVARQLANRADATGLSQAAVVRCLIEGAPAPLLGGHFSGAVKALAASTAELAIVAADLRTLGRLATRITSPGAEELNATFNHLADEVRAHVGRASRLVADLATLAPRRSRRSGETDEEIHDQRPQR